MADLWHTVAPAVFGLIYGAEQFHHYIEKDV